jgi:hypothetical protein
MLKCPVCQFENEEGALFCDQCKSDLGAPLALATATPVSPLAESSSSPVAELAHAEPIEGFHVAEAIPVADVAALAGDSAAQQAIPIVEATPFPVATETPTLSTLDDIKTTPVGIVEPTRNSSGAPTLHGQETGQITPGCKPKLVVLRGQRVNAEFPLYDGDNYIGRADDKPVDVDLEDQEPPDRIWSSRQHAVIVFEGANLTIEDLNSTNGTFVNRTRVHPGEKRPLQLNDVIQIGTVQMKLQL